MADDSPIKLRNSEELNATLKDFRADESWDQFKQKFLRPLIRALNREKDTVALGPALKDFSLESIKRFLPDFVKEDRFFPKLLRTWADNDRVTLNEAQLAAAQRQLENLISPDFEKVRTATPLEEWIKLADALLATPPATAAGEADQRRSRLRQLLDPRQQPFLELARLRPSLLQVIDDYNRGITLTSRVLDALPEEEKKAKKELFAAAEKRQQDQLDSALAAAFAELWENPWQSDTWARALLTELQRPPETSQEDLADYLTEALLADPDLDSDPLTAQNQAEVYFGNFLAKLEPQLRQLRQRYEDLQKQYQEALDRELQAIAAPPAAPAADLGGAQEPSEANPTQKNKTRLVDSTKQTLRGLLSPLADISDEDLQQLAELAKKSGVDLAEVKSLSELETAIAVSLEKRHADPAVTFENLESFSNQLLSGFSLAAKQYAPQPAAPERPAISGAAPGGLATAMPAEVVSKTAARRSVGELMQVQQLMVAQGLQELRWVLQKQKLPPQEIERILGRNRELLSHQTWMEFLQSGGLQGKLTYAQVVAVWLKSVQSTLDRIALEQGLRKVSLNVRAGNDLDSVLNEAGYNPRKLEEVFFDLKVDQFEELALFSEKDAAGTADQRRSDVRGVLLNNDFAETDAELAAALITQSNFTGLFEHELKKEELSAADRRSLGTLLQKPGLNAKEQEDFARILGLVFSDYPPEAFYYLAADEIASVHQLLARQQKAAQIIENRLQAVQAKKVDDKAARLAESGDFGGLVEFQLSRQPPVLTAVERQQLHALLQRAVLTPEDQTEFSRLLAIVLGDHAAAILPQPSASRLADLHRELTKPEWKRKIEPLLVGVKAARAPTATPAYFNNPFRNQQAGDLTLQQAEKVSAEEAETSIRETLMLEVTLSLAFETQTPQMAILIQQYYQHPELTLAMLADQLAESFDETGQMIPAAAPSPEQQAQLFTLRRANYQALAQRQQRSHEAKRKQQQAALAMAVISSGFNPALLAKRFLTDAQAREALIAEIKQRLPMILAGQGLMALPILLPWLGLLNLILDAIGFLQGLASGIGGAISSIGNFAGGLWSGITGGSSASHAAAAALGQEVGANAASTGKIIVNQTAPAASNAASSTVSNTFAATNNFLAATTTAATPALAVFAAIFGPMAFAVTMTFIVFSVIGGSLNDLPLGGAAGVRALPGEFGLLSTTDMACVSVDRDSFTKAGQAAFIKKAQRIAVLAMQDRDARKICNVAGKITIVYAGSNWGGWGHYTPAADGHQVDMGVHNFGAAYEKVGLWTFFHELGHVLQYSSDIQAVHDEAMGSRLVSSYDYPLNCTGGCIRRTESAAEGVALYLYLTDLPPYARPDRIIDIRERYPALYNALLGFFARL